MKYHKMLISLTRKGAKKIHPLPVVIGIVGIILIIIATLRLDVPEPFLIAKSQGIFISNIKETLLISAILGLVFLLFSVKFPFLMGNLLVVLSLIFFSAFLYTISILGMIGSGLVFLAGILSMLIRKDLISSFRW